jgi:RimJ/RimL family protein N-acetyltransferase
MLLLETPRLLLRPFESRDIQAFSDYRSDPEVARYQGWTAPYSRAQAALFVAEMMSAVPGQPEHWYQLAVERKAAEGLIGDIAFRLSADARQSEVGFTLARAHQGQGYAAEAVGRLVDYLFADLNLHRVFANCDPQNAASIRLLERLGFRREGLFVDSLWYKGTWASELWYALLRREWETHRVK